MQYTPVSNSQKVYFRVRSFIADFVHKYRNWVLRRKGYDIHPSTILEREISLDRLYPAGIHIGKNCLIGAGVTILSHDHCKRSGEGITGPLLLETRIGDRCFIAPKSIILPGKTIGDEVIVGAGAVVTKDVPDNTIVAGNPAKIIRAGIKMSEHATIINWSIDRGYFDVDERTS